MQEISTTDDICRTLNLAPTTASMALALGCEQGKVMFDLEHRVFRWREVLDTPFDDLKTEFDAARAANAESLARNGRVRIESETQSEVGVQVLHLLRGEVRGESNTYPVALTLDDQGRIVDGDCGCTWFRYNHLRGGPCKHLLALRLAAGAPQEPTQCQSAVAHQ